VGDPVIGMVGSFKRQKAHHAFLRMAQRIHRLFPEAWFLLVGEVLQDDFAAGSLYEAEVKQLATSLGLGHRCQFLGNQGEIKAVYNACDATALLSLREGTPNVLLESMACGVPVLASDIADNSVIVHDRVTGYIVPKADDGAAANCAIELLSDQVKRNRMGAAAREHVCREYSIDRAARKMEEIYRMFLERKSSCGATKRPRSVLLEGELPTP